MEELLYKLCGKVLPKHSFRPDMLLPFQLEVRSKEGAEPVVRAVEKAVEGSLPNQYSQLVLLGLCASKLFSQSIPGWEVGLRAVSQAGSDRRRWTRRAVAVERDETSGQSRQVVLEHSISFSPSSIRFYLATS